MVNYHLRPLKICRLKVRLYDYTYKYNESIYNLLSNYSGFKNKLSFFY